MEPFELPAEQKLDAPVGDKDPEKIQKFINVKPAESLTGQLIPGVLFFQFCIIADIR